MKSPFTTVKDKFGDKTKLVEAVQALATEELWLGRTNKDRGGDRGLQHVSNAKLLRLHAVFTEVKDKFGSRAKLIAQILESEKRTKDEGFKKRLEAYPVPRLFDMHKSSAKRAKAAQAKAKQANGEAKAPAAAEAKPAAAKAEKAAPAKAEKAAPAKAEAAPAASVEEKAPAAEKAEEAKPAKKSKKAPKA